MKNIPLILTFLLFLISTSYTQNIASFELELKNETNGLDVPVTANIEGIDIPDTNLILQQLFNGEETSVPCQFNNGLITWIIKSAKPGKYRFELIPGSLRTEKPVKIIDEDGSLTISSEDKNYLRYYYRIVYPPADVDTVYKRSGFIHPLWSPKGQILTRIQPPDHYHHYGIWNPWTHVLFEGDTVDFWNIGDKKGTVRFAGFKYSVSGDVFSEFKALHEHVVFKKDGGEKTALNELFTVRVYNTDSEDYYIAELESELSCAGENSVVLLEYRYGGLGWRTTEKWDKNNSEVITSEGKTRKNADGSLARWCIVQGEIDNDYAGVVLMSYTENYNHPEPLRIWQEDMYDRGDMFVNFSPTKNKNWKLEPGEKYILRYRLLVYNSKMTKDKAKSAWNYFADIPAVKLVSKQK